MDGNERGVRCFLACLLACLHRSRIGVPRTCIHACILHTWHTYVRTSIMASTSARTFSGTSHRPVSNALAECRDATTRFSSAPAAAAASSAAGPSSSCSRAALLVVAIMPRCCMIRIGRLVGAAAARPRQPQGPRAAAEESGRCMLPACCLFGLVKNARRRRQSHE